LDGLLDFAIEAHGGLRRWRQLTSITASLSFGGSMLTRMGWEGALERVVVSVDPRVQRALIGPFTAPDRRALFTGDRVAIETSGGRPIDVRFNPRAALSEHDCHTSWDAVDLAYFTGCAMWTSLTVPFLLNEPGFVTEELEPWQEDGETWRSLSHGVVGDPCPRRKRAAPPNSGSAGLRKRLRYPRPEAGWPRV
jgi:hypothetical protein